jgi:hypothetical protein
VSDEIWMEFMHEDARLCGLCGNHGVVDTRARLHSPAGVECGVLRFCICPNGRKMKEVGWKLESPRVASSSRDSAEAIMDLLKRRG